jgi:hypothetical protein
MTLGWHKTYDVVSKVFRTGAAIYTAFVVARSTGPNRQNCEFRVLLWRLAAIAWKRTKTSPWTLRGTDLAASPWQRPVSHFRPHPAVSGEKKGCHPPPTVLHWFGTLWLLPILKKCNWSWKDAGLIPLRRSRPNCRECFTRTLWQKRTFRKRSKSEGDDGTGVYMREGTTSSLMAADRPYGELYDFYSFSPECFEYTLVC